MSAEEDELAAMEGAFLDHMVQTLYDEAFWELGPGEATEDEIWKVIEPQIEKVIWRMLADYRARGDDS